MNMSAVAVVVIAVVVVCLIVVAGLGVWWVRSARARREHEENLRSLGVPAPRAGAEPFSIGDPQFEAGDTVKVTPLSGVEFDYERLAAEPFQAPPGVPFGQPVTPEPFSWTAAVSDPGPHPVPGVDPLPPVERARPVESAPAPVATSAPTSVPSPVPAPMSGPAVAVPPAAAPIHTPDLAADTDDDLDRTTVVRRQAPWAWSLVLPDGTAVPLRVDNVIGRRPEPIGEAHPVVIADSTRTLSKTHARLRFDGVGWVIEDLGSTNGVVLVHDDGREQELEPHQPVFATQWLLLGTLEVMLREGA